MSGVGDALPLIKIRPPRCCICDTGVVFVGGLHDGDVVDAYGAEECAISFEIKRQRDGLATETRNIVVFSYKRTRLQGRIRCDGTENGICTGREDDLKHIP